MLTQTYLQPRADGSSTSSKHKEEFKTAEWGHKPGAPNPTTQRSQLQRNTLLLNTCKRSAKGAAGLQLPVGSEPVRYLQDKRQ